MIMKSRIAEAPVSASHEDTLQARAVNSERHAHLTRLATAIGDSPRMAAQREKLPPQKMADPAQAKRTGLPDQLKAGIESLSGLSMDAVRVHYNSAKPAELQAHAYARGTDIHVAPGQEKHLPHEAWHVVQQAQGRVKPTLQAKGAAINDDKGLEGEADRMGARALQCAGQAAIPSQETMPAPAIPAIQYRKAHSRGAKRRTYCLPGAVRDHLFTNSNNGSGFHSVARNKAALQNHVQQTDGKSRDTEPYSANHLDNNGRRVAAAKSMFPDSWTEAKVVDVVERALTSPDIPPADAQRINREGTSEDFNRTLPNPVKGKAEGVRVEGITAGGVLQTVYPLVRN